MQLITTPSQLETEFLRLMDQYDHYHWSAAWAGIGNAAFEKLRVNRKKISRIIIGVHFYQTHPEFITTFMDHDGVAYIMQPDGTFHPKLYLFESDPHDWALLIGSANFTTAALTANSEATMLITSADNDSAEVYKNIHTFIREKWKAADYFADNQIFADYKRRWNLYRSRLRGAAGEFGTQSKKKEPPHVIPIMNWTWNTYIEKIQEKEVHGVDLRLNMLDRVQAHFRRYEQFRDIPTEERKFIAGVPNTLDDDWPIFGSMVGNGVFKHLVATNNRHISNALDQIPLAGEVIEEQYNDFCTIYQRTFDGTHFQGANNLGTATRLLAMKRPDIFVCYDKANESGICQEFRLKKKGIKFNTYWTDVIGRIQQCIWYAEPTPRDHTEQRLSKVRAAFLDSLFYEKK